MRKLDELEDASDLQPGGFSNSPKKLLKEESYLHDINQVYFQSYKQDIRERKKYASRIFALIAGWLAIILFIVVFQGTGYFPFGNSPFELTDAVVITLTGTTTANIAAYFLVVTKYLFPNHDKQASAASYFF